MFLEQVQDYIERNSKIQGFSYDNALAHIMSEMFRMRDVDAEGVLVGAGAMLYHAKSQCLFSDVKKAYIVSAYTTAIAEMYAEMETDLDDKTTVGALISKLRSIRAMFKRTGNLEGSAFTKRILNSIYGRMRQWHKIAMPTELTSNMRKYCHKSISAAVMQIQAQGGVVLMIDTDTIYYDQCGYDIILSVDNMVSENVNGQLILGDQPKRFVIIEKGRTSGVLIPSSKHLDGLRKSALNYIEQV